MKPMAYILPALLIMFPPAKALAAEDARELLEFPQMMRQHMLANMRDHLAAINEIIVYLGEGDLDRAADTAESRLGMSSLESHGAGHMGRFMPEGMRSIGQTMHRAASRFARTAQEGEALPAYRALGAVTSACVGCHAAYRVQ